MPGLSNGLGTWGEQLDKPWAPLITGSDHAWWYIQSDRPSITSSQRWMHRLPSNLLCHWARYKIHQDRTKRLQGRGPQVWSTEGLLASRATTSLNYFGGSWGASPLFTELTRQHSRRWESHLLFECNKHKRKARVVPDYFSLSSFPPLTWLLSGRAFSRTQ